ncbi:DUF3050 domain-containing protein [Agrilutibacter solisilvae]|uniref:DUF3050 domain-containing protein n=1 Tax=Agrilutibacter solisilvae TaxID=2763317 RepID=A0A974Y0A1_9GAMM|nr:DUF3050 domain-containing protein [Lysobacter solisilvae]QSX79056.1 DUF3050 domain-containing protein [Lysobacter solisilvae]
MAAVMDLHNDDLATLADLRTQLEQHPVFDSLTHIHELRRFMRAHVFAVWDFMSLLKRLQRDLTCVQVPWLPPRDRIAAHLINEIVLGEESDIGPDGEPASHLDLYLSAMREIGADTAQFEQFLALVGEGMEALDALHTVGAPGYVRAFVGHTLQVARQDSTLAVMTNFFHGRENVIPQMFTALLARWRIDEKKAPMFVFYLRRHIELDGESHGPMAQQIIERAIAGDPDRRAHVIRAAVESVRARIALWDGLQVALEEGVA